MAERRFTRSDEKMLVETIEAEQKRRENNRGDLEEIWKEVDRQVAEKPDLAYKKGNADKKWMPEVELPLQAAALEITVADANRLSLPKNARWFQANALISDEYLARIEGDSIIAGDENDLPSKINQDNANQLTRGWHEHLHRQYPFRERWASFHTEAAKYGTAVGKYKKVRKSRFWTETTGLTRQDKFIPQMIPRSLWNVYLDDSKHNALMEGADVGPSIHDVQHRSFEDLRVAAKGGSADPEDENGGWRRSALDKLEKAQSRHGKGEVKLIEVEGDHFIPRKTTRAMVLRNMIATVAVSGGEAQLVRLRINEADEPTYFSHRYHIEDIKSPYGVGPLMKAVPVQQAATEALLRLLIWAALNVEPPLGYDKNDPYFAQTGGPIIYPSAQWETVSGVQPAQIGDGAALFQLYVGFLRQYEDLTGVTSPRLGERTVSHTTAFAKDAELQRGVIRIVDYVNDFLDGPMHKWLQMEHRLGRKFSGTETIYIDDYGGFVDLQSKHLPDLVSYEVFGSAGPAEEREKLVAQVNAVQAAVQVELLKRQLGDESQPLDLTEIQRQMLRQGFTDVDVFFAQPTAAGASPVFELQPALTRDADPVTSLVETG